MATIDTSIMTAEEKAALFFQLQNEHQEEKNRKKEAFEAIRKDFITDVKKRFMDYMEHGKGFMEWLRQEAETYYNVMKEYGKLKREGQLGFAVSDEDFSITMKGSRVKKFDERADIAEKRLVDFLNGWIEKENGKSKNPMYKLAMAMIQRNEMGDLDYKSISHLYELESDFNDPEYSEIMELFRESNTVEGTSIKFYFETKDKYNNWKKIEPSFNRM